MKLNLVNSKEDRNYVMGKENEGSINLLDILKKYGEVADYMTEPMVADFYGVPANTLNTIGTTNKNELQNYGYRVYKKSECEKLLKTGNQFLGNIPNRGLRLYPIKAVILIGMMLTESQVAEKLRKDIMDSIFGNEVTVPTTEGIRKVVVEELDKKVPKIVGTKAKGVTEYINLVKRLLDIPRVNADYYNIMNCFKITHGVDKLEDLPYTEETMMELASLTKKYRRKVNGQKRLF